MKTKKFLLATMFAFIFIFMSCVKDDLFKNKYISFSANTNYSTEQLTASQQNSAPKTKTIYSGKDENNLDISKASVCERIDWQVGDVIYINMVNDNKTISDSDYTVESYQISSTDSSVSETISLTTEKPLSSPKNGVHHFFATYPSNQSNSHISKIDVTGSFTFSLPEEIIGYTINNPSSMKYSICDNMDYAYMVAYTKTNEAPKEVKLQFKPYFNAYQFILGESPYDCFLTGIKVTCKNGYLRTKDGHHLNGGIDLNGNNIPISGYSDETCSKTINYNFIKSSTPNGIHLNEEIGQIDITLITLPLNQSGIKVEFMFNRDGNSFKTEFEIPEEKVIRAYQKLRVINIGSVVTYEFGDLSDVEIRYTGGTDILSDNFVSTKKIGNTEPQQIGYTLQYSTDNGVTWNNSIPNWVTLVQNQNKYTVTLPQIQPSTTVTSHDELKQDWRKKENFNLAKYNVATGDITDVENSANCYVINGYGTYYFPMVYGNSLQNGNYINPSPYVNHNDIVPSSIIEPNQNKTAEVLWTDVPNLISNIQINTPSENYLFFEIKKENIKKGNAVIGVKVNGVIVWSWHIWVTDDDLTLKPEVLGKKFMPVNLGWVSTENNTTSRYLSRTCLVRAIQDESGNISQARILQTGYFESTFADGESLFYQWGRKDPFKVGLSYSTSKASVGTSIKNPTTFYSPSSNDWFIQSNISNTLWNNSDKKTIYDPSPVGYKVPSAFIGFAKENFIEITSPKGVRHKSATNLFFPASGKIGFGGNGTQMVVANKGNGGIYWSSTPKSNGNSYIIISFQWVTIGNTFVMYVPNYGDDYSHIKDGNTIRPIFSN